MMSPRVTREWKPIENIENNKAKYEGEWDLKGEIPDGEGTKVWPDGSIYVGMFRAGLAHGKGRLIHSDGDVYEGDWKSDKA
jgi:hypothetical protein